MSLLPDFLKKESIVPIRKLQDFKFLDRNEFLVAQDVEALAKKSAKNSLPPKATIEPDANELTFIQHLTQHAVSATMTLNDSLASISNSISKIDIESEKAELDSVVLKLEADLTKENEARIQDLKRLRDIAELKQSDVLRFKKDNGILREPRYKDSFMLTFAIIAFFLVIETALNSTLLAEASSLGLIGGAGMAIIISLINIALGFSAGWFLYPLTNQKNTTRARLWLVALLIAVTFVFVFNLLIGHYREVLIQDPDNSGMMALVHFSDGIFNLSEIESIFLIVIGLIVSGVSYWKGATQNDPYPGYTVLAKALDLAQLNLVEEKESVLEQLDELGEEYEQSLSEIHRKVSNDYSRYNTLNSSFYQQQKLYEAYLEDLAQTGQIATTLYRQTNISNREDDGPDYFKDKIVIDFKQKPSIPNFVDVGPSLNSVVENFGSRIPNLKIEFSKVLKSFRNKVVAIDL